MSSVNPAPRAKTTQACDPCRSLKVRCLPSSLPGVCKKCLNGKSGRASCTWAEQKPRRRSSKPSSKARVAELESKLDQLIARVDQSHANTDDSATLQEGLFDGRPFATSAIQSCDSCFSAPTTGSVPEGGFDSSSSTPLDFYACYPRINTDQSAPDVLLSCGISISAADGYLSRFRNMSTYFPFVIVPEEATVLSMSHNRPFLCIAALAAATSSEKILQRRLEQSFRIAILQKIMLDGERSLDLLQGLLVYLAWYHFYYMPKREQSYQLLQMATAMCVDLGLNLSPSEAMSRKVGLRLSHYRKADKPSTEHDAFFCREARRAYLGCYYLSTAISWITGKPNNMHVSDYMGDCGASLVDEMEYPTDGLLLPLIQLQQMAEENHNNLCMASGKISREEVQRIRTHLNAFRIQVDNWKTSVSPLLRYSPIIEMACHFAGIHAHEMKLINPFTKKVSQAVTATSSISEPFTSSIRLDVLLVCLDATKRFCEGFLALPAEEYRRMSFIQWSGLIYATVVLYKFSLGLPQVPEWDVSVARSAVNVEMFLETLYTRMHSASQSDPANLEKTDLFSMMGPIFENVKRTYDRLKQLPQSQSANDTNPVHATSFQNASASTASPLKLYQHRCPAFPFWKSQGTDMSLFQEVEGFPSGDTPVDTGVSDTFGGYNLVGDHDFWADTMPEGPLCLVDGLFQVFEHLRDQSSQIETPL